MTTVSEKINLRISLVEKTYTSMVNHAIRGNAVSARTSTKLKDFYDLDIEQYQTLAHSCKHLYHEVVGLETALSIIITAGEET